MNKIILILLSFSTYTFSQDINKKVISTGGNLNAQGYSISSSAGEPLIGVVSGTEFHLSQGFQSSSITRDAIPTGLSAYDITDTRFMLSWDNMNTSNCMVFKYHVRFRETGTTTWTTKSAGRGQCGFRLNTTEKLMINFNPSTTYDLRLRVQYCGTPVMSAWTSTINVTTEDVCPDLANMEVQTFNGQQNKAKFTWDTTGVYMFARLYTRVNGGSAPFDWTVQGGFGIDYPAFHKNIFTFTAGETYRVQGNSFCSATMSSFKGNLTPVVIWTQPYLAKLIDPNLPVKTLIRVTDILGREVNVNQVVDNTILIYIYNDCTIKKLIK